MSFSFDAAKSQGTPNATSNVPTTTTAIPFTFEVPGGGDARKPIPAGFPAMINSPYAKSTQPSQNLSTGANSTIQATGYGFGTSGTTAPPTGMVLGGMAAPGQTPALPFGVATTQTTGMGFGASSATPGTGFTASLGSTTGFSLGSTTVTTAVAATTGWAFDTSKTAASMGFSLGGGETMPGASTASALTFGTPGGITSGFHLGNATGTLTSTSGTAVPVTTFSLGSNTTVTTPMTAAPTTAITLAAATTAATTTTATTATVTTMATTATATTTIATTSGPGLTLDATKTSGAQPGMDVGFSFGSGSSTAATTVFGLNKTAAVTASSSSLTATTTPSLGTTTTVTSSTGGGQIGAINFCQLEESINKWTLELEEQEKVFVNQATQINAWDKLLIANGEKIVTLNREVERVNVEQQQLEHELDYVVGQQKELQDCLEPLEKELVSLSVSDPEREYTYRLAENLDTQLKQMSEDLKEIIEHLNEANRTQDSSDPIVQIGKILNAHMNSLQWLDQRTALLSQKIQQIDQMHQNFRQENERSFSLAYT